MEISSREDFVVDDFIKRPLMSMIVYLASGVDSMKILEL